MKKSSKMLMGALVLVGVVLAGIYSAGAYQGDYSKKGPNYSEERHAVMTAAFEKNDYNAWKEEVDKNSRKGRVTEVVNEENFAKFAEARRLSSAGDTAGADAIRAELGLRTSDGKRGGHGFCDKQGRGNGEGCGQCQHRVQTSDDKRDGHGFCDKQGRGNGEGCGQCKYRAQNQ